MYSTTSRCLCHSESCANHAIKLAIILAESYSLSSSPRVTRYRPRRLLLAIVLTASYSLSSSPRPTRSHTCCVLLPPILITSYSLSYSPCPTRYRPRHRRPHCHPPHSRCAHHVVLITSCSSRCAHRVVLIASCRISQLSFVSDTQQCYTRQKQRRWM